MPFFYCAPPEWVEVIAVVLNDERSWAPAIFDCDRPDVIFTVVDARTTVCASKTAIACTTRWLDGSRPPLVELKRAFVTSSMIVEHELGHALYKLPHTPGGVMGLAAEWPSRDERLWAGV